MNISQTIAAACQGAVAYTLAGGYAVHKGNTRKLFPPGRMTDERRNKSGRYTYARASYSDGSFLVFTFHTQRGAKLIAQ